jgi:hypothetical protein
MRNPWRLLERRRCCYCPVTATATTDFCRKPPPILHRTLLLPTEPDRKPPPIPHRTLLLPTELDRKPPPARPSVTRCGPRSPCSLRSLRRQGRFEAGGPFQSRPVVCRTKRSRVVVPEEQGAPTPPRADAGLFRHARCRERPPRGWRPRASWSRNRPGEQPLPGRERVAERSEARATRGRAGPPRP